MIYFFLYNFFQILFLPAFLTIYFIQMIFLPKRRNGFFRKLGLYLDKKNSIAMMIHCVSVGETLSAIPFVKKMSEIVNKNILFTTSTHTGWKVAHEKIRHFVEKIDFFPFDFLFSIYMFYKAYNPKCIILTETEIWPNMIFFAKFYNIPIFVINGRISDRSYPKYKKFRFFLKSFLDYPYFLMQSEKDQERIINLGASSQKTINTGNIKYDYYLSEVFYDRYQFGFSENDIILLAGSTHDGEEKIILDAYISLKSKFKNLKLILAPRHPERFGHVEKIVKESGVKYTLRTENNTTEDVLILNTIGELKNMYSICDIAFVGGSLVNIGGHNIIEPAIFQKPVIFGPYMQNFRDICEEFLKEGGGVLVDDKNIIDKIAQLIENSDLRKKIGKRAKMIVEKNTGSLDKTINFIMEKINVR